MIFTIFGGAEKDIKVGDYISCVSGYLPPAFNDQAFEVVSIENGEIYSQTEDGQLSVITPSLIVEVIS